MATSRDVAFPDYLTILQAEDDFGFSHNLGIMRRENKSRPEFVAHALHQFYYTMG
jgi:hypothetical protein